MIPRRALALARSQSGNFTRSFCRSSVDYKGIAISGLNESASYNPSSSRASISDLSPDLRKVGQDDLPLLGREASSEPDVPEEVTTSLEDAPHPTLNEASEVSTDGREEIAPEESIPRLNEAKSTQAPSSSSSLPMTNTALPRRKTANRNPFEPKGNSRTSESGESPSGLRKRAQMAKAREEGSSNVVINSRRARLEEKEEDQYGLGEISSSDFGKKEQAKALPNQPGQANVSIAQSDQGQSQPEDQQLKQIKIPDSGKETILGSGEAKSRSTPITRPTQSRKTALDAESSIEEVSGSTSSHSADISPDIKILPSSVKKLQSRQVRLNTALLERASTENWSPLTPLFLDGQREGCAEAGFENWTVFTKVGSGGLRIRLFARRIITDSSYGLTIISAVSTSMQHSQKIPDTLFYRQLDDRTAVVQIEVAGIARDRIRDEEDGNLEDGFEMYPDVSKDQIRLIRQMNLVLKRQEDIKLMMRGSNRGTLIEPERRNSTGSFDEGKGSVASLEGGVETSNQREYSEIPKPSIMEKIVHHRRDMDEIDEPRSRLINQDMNQRQRQANLEKGQLPLQRTKMEYNQDRFSSLSYPNLIKEEVKPKSSISPFGQVKPRRDPKMVSNKHAEWRKLSELLKSSTASSKMRTISVPSNYPKNNNSDSNGSSEQGKGEKVSQTMKDTREAEEAARATATDTDKNSKTSHRMGDATDTEKKRGGIKSSMVESKAEPAVEEFTPVQIDKGQEEDEADGTSRKDSPMDEKSAELTNDEPIESATPVSIDGDQAESNKDVSSIKGESSLDENGETASADKEIPDNPSAVESATPVHIDGNQVKGSDDDSKYTFTESTKTSLEKQAVESSAEITNQDESTVPSSKGSIEESTPVVVDGEQAKGGVKEEAGMDEPIATGKASASSLQDPSPSHGSIEEATPVNLDESQASQTAEAHLENDVQADIDPNTVDEAKKKKNETIDKVEDAVKESPLGQIGGEDQPVDEATPVNVEGDQVEKKAKVEEVQKD